MKEEKAEGERKQKEKENRRRKETEGERKQKEKGSRRRKEAEGERKQQKKMVALETARPHQNLCSDADERDEMRDDPT